MEKLIINGGRRLNGEITIHGSKNSALPILAATVLTAGECVLHNCPDITDVDAAAHILRWLGCKIKRENSTIVCDSSACDSNEVPCELMHCMRSSVIFMGAMLARNKKAVLSTPGGCEIGLRPIDMHISAVRQLGAKVYSDGGRLCIEAENGLKGAHIKLGFPSVGATENILLAACTAQGTTVIENAAREPEIADLADFLNKCGAEINISGSRIVIEGVKKLHGSEHTVIPDRIAAASYLCAAAASAGRILVNGIVPNHIAVLIPIFQEMGCEIKLSRGSIRLNAPFRLNSVGSLATAPYPGFPTDIQAPMTAALSVANGVSGITENIFESRFKHIPLLNKFGADIAVEGKSAIIKGVSALHSANVGATDLRGGFALIIATLCAKGESQITEIHHIYRGYEKPEQLLAALGAEIKRI